MRDDIDTYKLNEASYRDVDTGSLHVVFGLFGIILTFIIGGLIVALFLGHLTQSTNGVSNFFLSGLLTIANKTYSIMSISLIIITFLVLLVDLVVSWFKPSKILAIENFISLFIVGFVWLVLSGIINVIWLSATPLLVIVNSPIQNYVFMIVSFYGGSYFISIMFIFLVLNGILNLRTRSPSEVIELQNSMENHRIRDLYDRTA